MIIDTVLPLLLDGLVIGVVLPLLGLLIQAARKALAATAADREASAFARLAADVGGRVILEVDHAIDTAATETTGLLARARRPESPGGMKVTPEEWVEIRDAIAESALAGLGRPWTERLLRVVSGVGQPSPEVASSSAPLSMADARAHLRRAVESRYAERVDLAVAAGLREAPHVPDPT